MNYAALLDRPIRTPDVGVCERAITGKRILITGAGGTIGSALAEMCVGLEPERLTLLDRDERRLVEVHDRLNGHAFVECVLGDVTRPDKREAGAIGAQVVFHAAAYKHVPFLENQWDAAWTNNVQGTKNILEYARRSERFVLVSTDKAVNPTSVMGATKASAEELTSLKVPWTMYGMVATIARFGNVLGSSGSVLETWQRQLDAGEPLTITDPDMTRYFITVEEAAWLCIASAGLDVDHGSVCMLDMGKAVSMDNLSDRFLWRRASHHPYPCTKTGPRPGEKQHEDLVRADEHEVARHGDVIVYGTTKGTRDAGNDSGTVAARLPAST